MRRIAGILVVLAAAVALVTTGSGASGDDGSYTVRAIFDNGSFVVADEEVRIAGAKVGSVDSVDVTVGDERAHEDGSPDPGKAVVVLRIDDPGFQDFREDASCLIRPQSLLGEKFVECTPTQQRFDGGDAPPELDVIPDGEPGEGQRFLPVEQNGKAVDLDLVNNIMGEPYPDRFRLILNELGIGLATRGEDIDAIIERGNPALRETNELLALLKSQTQALNNLARDGQASLEPLSRERESLVGFINNATVAGGATAERTDDLEAGFQRMPQFFEELRLTMVELRRFTDATTPVLADFEEAAPALTRSTRALGPFSRAGIPAFQTLGDAAESAGPDLVASVPVIRDLGRLAEETTPGARFLDTLLTDFRRQDGLRNLLLFFYYGTGAVNGYDSFGHYARTVVPANNCFTYKIVPEPGCDINFNRTFSAAAKQRARAAQLSWFDDVELPDFDEKSEVEGTADATGGTDAEDRADPATTRAGDSETVLEFLLGSGERE